MRKNIKSKREYITSDANAKGMMKNPNHIANMFLGNSDFYKIARVFVGKDMHNTVQFLCYKNGMSNQDLIWSTMPYIDYKSDEEIENSKGFFKCCSFNSVEEADEFLKIWIENQNKIRDKLNNNRISMFMEFENQATWENADYNYGDFKDCKYLIIRCINSLDIALEKKGLVFNNDTQKVDNVDSCFEITSQKRDEIENKPSWYYVTDKLPPNPKENEDGISIQPLNYICAYECGDDGCGGIDYECDEFMYMGNGEWLGENKKYPIYAWLEHSVEVPKPRKE